MEPAPMANSLYTSSLASNPDRGASLLPFEQAADDQNHQDYPPLAGLKAPNEDG
jgi:hypothetical protein